MATITQVKEKIGIQVLELEKSVDEQGVYSGWLRHWDNDKRVSVSIHEDLAKELKANPNIKSLGTQYDLRETDKGTYHSYRIIKYNSNPEIIL